jgi:hypothetical protein
MPAAMANSNSKLPLVMGLAAVGTMGVGFFLALGTAGTDSPPVVARQQAPAQVAVANGGVQAVPLPPSPEPAVTAPVPGSGTHEPSIKRNRMTRDVKREQIWSALGREHSLEPVAPGSAAPSEKAAARLPTLDPQYIQSAITEQLLPVAIECYESALADDPTLAGRLVAEFTIIGVEGVGGVVEEAEIQADESTLDNEFVRECMRESLMAVTFEPPTDGGRVEVTYPFVFAPSAGQADQPL